MSRPTSTVSIDPAAESRVVELLLASVTIAGKKAEGDDLMAVGHYQKQFQGRLRVLGAGRRRAGGSKKQDD